MDLTQIMVEGILIAIVFLSLATVIICVMASSKVSRQEEKDKEEMALRLKGMQEGEVEFADKVKEVDLKKHQDLEDEASEVGR